MTESGEALQLSAHKIEIEVLKFEESQTELNKNTAGELRVLVINNMASTILMPMITIFSVAYPKIVLHLMVTNKFVKLAVRDADIAIKLTTPPRHIDWN